MGQGEGKDGNWPDIRPVSELSTKGSIKNAVFEIIQFINFFLKCFFLGFNIFGQYIEFVGDASLFGERRKGD